MRGGIGDTTRYIPVHRVGVIMGPIMCEVLPAVYQLSGCDTTSKFGTKQTALKVSPDHYLSEFGQDPNDIYLNLVEEYLVQVLKPGTPLKTLNDLRYHLYHHSKKTLDELPPTSQAAKEHILRAFYGTHIQVNCLRQQRLDSTVFGCYKENDVLLLCNPRVLVPEDLVSNCN